MTKVFIVVAFGVFCAAGLYVRPLENMMSNDESVEEPVVRHDEQFGTLTFDRSVGEFTAATEWNGAEITLILSIEDNSLDADTQLEAAMQAARTLWNDQEPWKRRVEDFAVQELLPLKNNGWLEEGEDELTAEEFKQRMSLESISVWQDGSFDFWYEDGDLFWGHAIQIGGSLTEGVNRADIPG